MQVSLYADFTPFEYMLRSDRARLYDSSTFQGWLDPQSVMLRLRVDDGVKAVWLLD